MIATMNRNVFVKQKVTRFYFFRVIFAYNGEKILESSRCIISLDEHIDTDATQARSGKDLKIRHEAAKTGGILMYIVELCSYLFLLNIKIKILNVLNA